MTATCTEYDSEMAALNNICIVHLRLDWVCSAQEQNHWNSLSLSLPDLKLSYRCSGSFRLFHPNKTTLFLSSNYYLLWQRPAWWHKTLYVPRVQSARVSLRFANTTHQSSQPPLTFSSSLLSLVTAHFAAV